jgi:hypothetical protein
MADRLADLLDAEVQRPAAAAVEALAEVARQRHGAAVAAVLFYGSCLQQDSVAGKLVDLYVLVDDYGSAHRTRLAGFLNWALPPNVYFLEVPDGDSSVCAKYAVISLRAFANGAGGGWFHPYLWARFAQPSRLVYCRDAATRAQVVAALTGAVLKTVSEGMRLVADPTDSRALWTSVFRQTYRTELRAERPERAADLVAANRAYFDAVGAAAVTALQDRSAAPARGPGLRWLGRRLLGKILSVLRLVKAAFTFEDGAQYLKWKIERHSGVTVPLSPWQRRHPVLGSTVLFWKLYRRGAFR